MLDELTLKALTGKKLTDEESKRFRDRNAKYEIIRFLVMEKQRADGVDLKDFHFTPGDNFEETPTIDVVNEIIESFSAPWKPMNFGDKRLKKANVDLDDLEIVSTYVRSVD
jgi:hypothetical protein